MFVEKCPQRQLSKWTKTDRISYFTLYFFCVSALLPPYQVLQYNSNTLKRCTMWRFLVYSQSCATIPAIQFQNSFITWKRNPIPMKQSLPLRPFCESLVTTNLPYVSMDFPVLDFLYIWNHATCSLLYFHKLF